MATSTNQKKPAKPTRSAAAKTKKQTAKKKKTTPPKKRPTQSKTTGKTSGSRKAAATTTKKPLNRKALVLAVLAILTVLGLVLLATALHAGAAKRNGTAVVLPDKDIAWGIDVSSHNGDIDWSAVSGEADFAFVRAGYRGYNEGEINADKNCHTNLKEAYQNGVPAGVYFYSQAVTEEEAKEEAAFVLEHIKGYRVSLPVVIDFEYAYKNGAHHGRLWDADLSKQERTAVINAFCDTVRDAGYTPGIYASTYIFESHLNRKDIPSDVFIWVADYNESITYDGAYDIWQYSESGACPGVSSTKVDTDYRYTTNRK